MAAWGERMARYLIDAMAREVPPVNRRYLVDALGWLGHEDVRVLAAMVADPRWYIARNLAIALGKTGRPQASPACRDLHGSPTLARCTTRPCGATTASSSSAK